MKYPIEDVYGNPVTKGLVIRKVIQTDCWQDDVNGWYLNDDDLVFSSGEKPVASLRHSEPALCLKIYKRKDNNGVFYSFVIGWLDYKKEQQFMPIDGFNLVKEQIKDIF